MKAKLDENLLSARNQPTTANLVTMSMAKLRNIDVSDWYVEKFIGKIIKFDSNMSVVLHDCFMENFNKIVSNPVGRVLLFRILVEVKIVSPDEKREKLKEIRIVADSKLGFSQKIFGIYFANINTKSCLIKKEKSFFRTTYRLVEDDSDNLDINLFHEMCHWFHALSNFERMKEERNVIDLFSNPLGRYYWGNIKKFSATCDNMPLPLNQEGFFWTNREKTSFEEIRTILGANYEVEDYKEGDDLCENLYRISCNKKIRWSHKNSDFIIEHKYIPDLQTLKRTINSAFKSYNLYK